MRYLGLDYGSKTVGVALSDPSGSVALPLETISREDEVNLKETVRRIRALCEEHGVETVVVGLPKNMDGSMGVMAEKAMAFAHRLERDLYRVEVALWDERLSTQQAMRPLFESGKKNRKERKETVDKLAAGIILQSYLDALKAKEKT